MSKIIRNFVMVPYTFYTSEKKVLVQRYEIKSRKANKVINTKKPRLLISRGLLIWICGLLYTNKLLANSRLVWFVR